MQCSSLLPLDPINVCFNCCLIISSLRMVATHCQLKFFSDRCAECTLYGVSTYVVHSFATFAMLVRALCMLKVSIPFVLFHTQCQYTAEIASDLCKKESHNLVRFKATKKFFECKDCKQRRVTYNEALPSKACMLVSISSTAKVACHVARETLDSTCC